MILIHLFCNHIYPLRSQILHLHNNIFQNRSPQYSKWSILDQKRTRYVRGFTFEWNGDNVSCSFIVKGIENEEFQVTI